MNYRLCGDDSVILMSLRPGAPYADREVWKRDQGKCQACGMNSGLHFDHIIPYSKGGSSKDPANIQILCGRYNLAKRDNIE